MSDRSQIGGNSGKNSALQAAYDRARSLQQSVKIKDQHIPRNIKRHRLVPALTPTGNWRREPDRESFLAREAQDRRDALKRNKQLQNQPQIDKSFDRGMER